MPSDTTGGGGTGTPTGNGGAGTTGSAGAGGTGGISSAPGGAGGAGGFFTTTISTTTWGRPGNTFGGGAGGDGATGGLTGGKWSFGDAGAHGAVIITESLLPPPPSNTIPSMGEWGLIILGLMSVIFGVVMLNQRYFKIGRARE